MPASSYMCSLLCRQLMLLDEAKFLAQHPYAWLVWEPGKKVAPASPAEHETSTRIPDSKRLPDPANADALCFELKVEPDVDARLTAGRSRESDIVLDDMTVSREQFVLHHSEGYWAVLNAAGAKTSVDGVAAQHKPVVLQGRETITAGGLKLTFYLRKQILERLRAEIAARSPE